MFEITAERTNFIVMLGKLASAKIACQLMIGELEEITRPGFIVKVTETHLQFEELYFTRIITLPLSNVNGIVERPKDGRSALLEDNLPEVSKFAASNGNLRRINQKSN
jgi:hypothetical protein